MISFGARARNHLLDGVDTLVKTVRSTLGPRGRSVIMERVFGPAITSKDGVTVAKDIELENGFKNIGVKMLTDVAKKMSNVAGDGTTTAILLAYAICNEGQKLVAAGANPMALKRGLDKGVAAILQKLEKLSKPIQSESEIAQVGTLSSNHDETIGKLISEAMQKVGKEGVITVEEGKSIETTLEIVEGMQFKRGYISPYFITNLSKMEAVLQDPFILLYEKKISNLKTLLPLLEQISKTRKPILIIAEDVDGEALAALVVNKIRGVIKSVAIKAPGFGTQRRANLEDLAILTGGRLFSEDLGSKLETAGVSDLGRCKIVRIDKENTTIIDGAGDPKAVEARINHLKSLIEETTSDFDREKFQERMAKLSGGVAIIRVGGASDPEVKEKKPRVEDALNATKAAVEKGIVPGGGVALLRCADALEKVEVVGDEKLGLAILKQALKEPLYWIAENAGVEGSVVVNKVLEGKDDFGFNAATLTYEKLMDTGVIDPSKVVHCALQFAASVAGLMVTTEALVTKLPEKKKIAPDRPDVDEDMY